MEITRSNFNRSLQVVLESIEDCDYVAIDTEFTGLRGGSLESKPHRFDSLEDRYQKIRANCEKHWMCQLGLCTFKYLPEQNRYLARPFNIYVIPYSRMRELTISPSSMMFLVENGFDMNRLFTEGVKCCRLTELQSNLNHPPSFESGFAVSQEHQKLLQEYTDTILEFLGTSEKTMKIPIKNNYLKKLFFGNYGVQKCFQNLDFTVETQSGEILVKVSKLKRKKAVFIPQESTQPTELEHDLKKSDMLGATMIFCAVLHHKKPIVGHNLIYDLAFLYSHFITDLPPTVREFNEALAKVFPPIFDTKYIAKQIGEKKLILNTGLSSLFRSCQKRIQPINPVTVEFDSAFKEYSGEEKEHEAGYDAYVTGYIMAVLTNYLASKQEVPISQVNDLLCNKVSLSDHYLPYIDINSSVQEQRVFDHRVLKLVNLNNKELKEVVEDVARFGDAYVLRVGTNCYFADFEMFSEGFNIKKVVQVLNEQEEYQAFEYVDRDKLS
mmetsp:Transcript_9339/g.13902  ORF Transcript_9339/g.13902 Transcript_9339/m.13902 type:complete len:495 (-) Transcript_9339:51-1535(-)